MLSPVQLKQLATAATMVRTRLEAAIGPAPVSPAAFEAFARLSSDERASQRDLTAASAHLAQATALLHRVADYRSRPVIEAFVL